MAYDKDRSTSVGKQSGNKYGGFKGAGADPNATALKPASGKVKQAHAGRVNTSAGRCGPYGGGKNGGGDKGGGKAGGHKGGKSGSKRGY